MSLDEMIAEAMATAARLNALCDRIEAREAGKDAPRKHWLSLALARVKAMDDADGKSGMATPEQVGIADTIGCIDAALDAAISLAGEGRKKQAREVAEEAVAMAMKIKI